MKRGDYVPPTGSRTVQVRDANLLVDFDRKWAEAGRPSGFISSDDEESDLADADDLVEYEDEFGRQRQGTRADARREERRRAAQAHAAETLQELSARPAPPPNLIRGDVIQSAAFNPEAQIAAQMEEMARRRDRSLTPPPQTHYDANSEIRSKGVGFYAFSREEGERRREMEALKRERRETERKRAAQVKEEEEVHEDIDGRDVSRSRNPNQANHPTKADHNDDDGGGDDGAHPSNMAETTVQQEETEVSTKEPSLPTFSYPPPAPAPAPAPSMKHTFHADEEEEEEEVSAAADDFLASLDNELVRDRHIDTSHKHT